MTTKIAYIVGLFVLGTCGVFVASHRVVKHGQQDKSAMSKQGAEMEAVQNAEEETKPAAKLETVQKTYEAEEGSAELQASGLIEKETNEGTMEGSIICKSWCIKCGDRQIFVARESSKKQLIGSAAKVAVVGVGAQAGGAFGAVAGAGAAAGGELAADYGAEKMKPGEQRADCAIVKIYSSKHSGDTPTADSKAAVDEDFHGLAPLAVLRMAPTVTRFVDFMKAMSHEKICGQEGKAEKITEHFPRSVPWTDKYKLELRNNCLINPQ
jgi:hypothetical protein